LGVNIFRHPKKELKALRREPRNSNPSPLRWRAHKTSISLENEFWDALKLIARTQNMTISILLESIATKSPQSAGVSRMNHLAAARGAIDLSR
jgi:predicted DNA-binding ribbon-helix-helix protein